MTIFEDRYDAGVQLAKRLQEQSELPIQDPIVLAIPRGGIPVGKAVAEALVAPLDVIVLRKLPIPHNDQMGFGAVNLDKDVILNQALIDQGYVSKEEIEPVVEEVYAEIQRRSRKYRGEKPLPLLSERSVILVDDGLATGFTMLAAVEFVRRKQPVSITVAVPVAHSEAYGRVASKADNIVCMYVSHMLSFAVASFYERFPDLHDDEVLRLLNS